MEVRADNEQMGQVTNESKWWPDQSGQLGGCTRCPVKQGTNELIMQTKQKETLAERQPLDEANRQKSGETAYPFRRARQRCHLGRP
jgi:hypothetical protein